MRLRLEYSDQNEGFAACLPRDGSVVRRVALADWGDDWYLLHLDQPFEYAGHTHDQVLIRSRWEGHTVGAAEPTSVFILLIPHLSALDAPKPSSASFEHVAWGMAHALPAA